jgi:hypothetical protein
MRKTVEMDYNDIIHELKCSQNAKAFILKLLTKKENLRPNASEAL